MATSSSLIQLWQAPSKKLFFRSSSFVRALKKTKKVGPTKGIANIAKRERNRGAKQLDTLMKELAVPLRTCTEKFPNKKTLHPYELFLVELTLGDGIYEEVLGKVDTLRRRVVSLGKEHASLCSKSSTKKEAEERLIEGMKKLEDIFNRGRSVVDDLLHIAKNNFRIYKIPRPLARFLALSPIKLRSRAVSTERILSPFTMRRKFVVARGRGRG